MVKGNGVTITNADEPIMTSNSRESVLTVPEVAAYLKIPRATVYKLRREGKLPAHKVGKHWRFMRDELDNWLKAA